MEISAYPEMYLEMAADNLGTMLDTAVNKFGYSAEETIKMFIESKRSKEFQYGFVRVVRGMSGRELLNDIVYRLTGKELENFRTDDFHLCKTKEYWAGWILAQYQWYSCQSFEDIFKAIRIDDLISRYYPLHEAPEIKTFEIIDKKMKAEGFELYNTIAEDGDIVNLKKYQNPFLDDKIYNEIMKKENKISKKKNEKDR